MPKAGLEVLSIAILKRLRTIPQLVVEYPGLCPSEDSLRWRLRMLKADIGPDLRVCGVYRDRRKILIDPAVFFKEVLQ
ncbi:MAG: hypothetical protein JSV08_04605 [Acidobacteriota bacterium]|nr:MAG: hypothetical protein JSV08_04605 [Acidobacteriota bacterium]